MVKLNEIIAIGSSSGSGGYAVTIGNFDGCHRGHQALLSKSLTVSQDLGVPGLALTFSPSPRAFFQPSQAIKPLMTDAQKLRAFAEFGMGAAFFQNFDQKFSQMSHQQFFDEILRNTLQCKALIVGYDFAFGHQRRGDLNYLKQACLQNDIALEVVEPLKDQEEVVSSSLIRKALLELGNMSRVSRLLGRPYLVEGVIRQGAQMGRKLGFPTANLEEVQQLLPKNGVYTGLVYFPQEREDGASILTTPPDSFPAVINIGIRPTLGAKEPRLQIEAHLLDQKLSFDALYNKRAAFYLTDRIRDEKKFNSLDDLTQQIAKDAEQARVLLS